MRLRSLGLILLAVLVGTLVATDVPAAPKPATTVDAAQLPAGQIAGQVVSLPDSDRMMTVAVTYPQVVPNPKFKGAPNVQRQYNHVLQLQAQLNNPKNRNRAHTMQQMQQALVQLQTQLVQAQMNAVKVTNVTANVDFQVAEDVKVRTAQPPVAFDDKGNIKKYTREELKELKGKDPSLPGYESSPDALKVGQVVQVTLAAHHTPKTAASEKAKDADKEKEKDADKPKEVAKDAPKVADKDKDHEKKMQVRLIVILDDGSSSDTSKTKKDPKGNK
jgi:hypothetical protein